MNLSLWSFCFFLHTCTPWSLRNQKLIEKVFIIFVLFWSYPTWPRVNFKLGFCVCMQTYWFFYFIFDNNFQFSIDWYNLCHDYIDRRPWHVCKQTNNKRFYSVSLCAHRAAYFFFFKWIDVMSNVCHAFWYVFHHIWMSGSIESRIARFRLFCVFFISGTSQNDLVVFFP